MDREGVAALEMHHSMGKKTGVGPMDKFVCSLKHIRRSTGSTQKRSAFVNSCHVLSFTPNSASKCVNALLMSFNYKEYELQ